MNKGQITSKRNSLQLPTQTHNLKTNVQFRRNILQGLNTNPIQSKSTQNNSKKIHYKLTQKSSQQQQHYQSLSPSKKPSPAPTKKKTSMCQSSQVQQVLNYQLAFNEYLNKKIHQINCKGQKKEFSKNSMQNSVNNNNLMAMNMLQSPKTQQMKKSLQQSKTEKFRHSTMSVTFNNTNNNININKQNSNILNNNINKRKSINNQITEFTRNSQQQQQQQQQLQQQQQQFIISKKNNKNIFNIKRLENNENEKQQENYKNKLQPFLATNLDIVTKSKKQQKITSLQLQHRVMNSFSNNNTQKEQEQEEKNIKIQIMNDSSIIEDDDLLKSLQQKKQHEKRDSQTSNNNFGLDDLATNYTTDASCRNYISSTLGDRSSTNNNVRNSTNQIASFDIKSNRNLQLQQSPQQQQNVMGLKLDLTNIKKKIIEQKRKNLVLETVNTFSRYAKYLD